MKPVNRRSRSREDHAAAVAAVRAVRAVYADLATRPATRGCVGRSECCRFRLTGRLPFLTRGEALVAARAWRATGRTSLPDAPPAPDGACPLLDPATARCRIYADRPFACRTHFCREAGGTIPRTDVLDLIRRLETIDGQLDGDRVPRPLPTAVAAELGR